MAQFSIIMNAAFAVIFATSLLIPSGYLRAQPTSDEKIALEEIIVTSRRYAETIEDAPVAVAVLTSKTIKTYRIERADDILNYTPGATWESFSKVQPIAAMRGVIAPTPGNSSSEASIQTVVDNVVITKDFMKAPPLFDLSRVEVLRGPQGTSFGRNASVGLIHFVTAKPSQENSAHLSGTVGSDEIFEVDGHINGALGKNWSARLAFNFDSQEGPTKSISTGEGIDGDSNKAIRASLLYKGNDNFSAYFKFEHSVDRDDAPVRHGYIQPNGSDCSVPYVDGRDTPAGRGNYRTTFFDDCNDPFKTEISSGQDFHLDRSITTATAELAWNLNNGLAITSITGYMEGDNDSLADLIGTPNDVAFQVVTNDGNSFSQEVRVDSASSDSAVRWLAGVYYLTDEEDRFEENQFQATAGARTGPWVPTFLATFSNNVTTSISVFAEITWDINEKFSLTYGGRYVDDEKNYTYNVRASGVNRQLIGVPGVAEAGAELIDGVAAICSNMGPPTACGSRTDALGFTGEKVDDSWSDFISKVSLSYEINNNLNLYALYSEGFKSGTFQPDARNKESVRIVVEPETAENFEIGLKGVSNKARFSATLFQLGVDDVQTINQIAVGDGFTGLASNVGAVSTAGIEVEGTFILGNNFLFGGNFAVLDAELEDTPDPSGTRINPATGAVATAAEIAADPTIPIYDVSGERPPGAPEWTFAFFGEYTFDLSRGSSLAIRSNVRGRSDVYNQTSFRYDDSRVRPEVVNVGASLAWTNAQDTFTISLWGKNLNEDIDVENFGPPSPCCSSFATGFRNKRTFGVTAVYNWK